MHRRGFFQAISAAFAGSAVAPLLPATTTATRYARFSERARDFWPVITTTPAELIESSLRLIGLLAGGEHASMSALQAAYYALCALDPNWRDMNFTDGICVPAPKLRSLRWALATELAPEYRVGPPYDTSRYFE